MEHHDFRCFLISWTSRERLRCLVHCFWWKLGSTKYVKKDQVQLAVAIKRTNRQDLPVCIRALTAEFLSRISSWSWRVPAARMHRLTCRYSGTKHGCSITTMRHATRGYSRQCTKSVARTGRCRAIFAAIRCYAKSPADAFACSNGLRDLLCLPSVHPQRLKRDVWTTRLNCPPSSFTLSVCAKT